MRSRTASASAIELRKILQILSPKGFPVSGRNRRRPSLGAEHMFTGASSSRQAGKREKVLLRVLCHVYETKIVLLLKPSRQSRRTERQAATA